MTIPKTNWIWTPDWTDHDKSQARIVYFRKTVEISDDAAKAPFRIRISADSRYKLYVNGAFVQDGPQKALDLKEWFVDEADLANYLHPGKNTVAVEVLRYPEPNLAFGAPVSNDSLLKIFFRCRVNHIFGSRFNNRFRNDFNFFCWGYSLGCFNNFRFCRNLYSVWSRFFCRASILTV